MRLVEGTVRIGDDVGDGAAGGEVFADVDGFVERLDAIGREHGVTVQAFDARYVVSRRHLERAVELADRERARGDGIARDRGVEVLLYAAGRRQINRALEMGVAAGETPTVVLVDADPDATRSTDDGHTEGDVADPADEDATDTTDGAGGVPAGEAAAADAVAALLEPADTLGAYDAARVRSFFDVAQAELDATARGLEALVLERVALLVVER